MTRREILTAETIDDAEELINDYMYLLEQLLRREASANSYYRPVFTDLLDEGAGV